jgi:GntR family transcriptional regulator / MocR family aminotransferase
VWFRDLPRASEAILIEAARLKGLGIYPLSPLYDPRHPGRRPAELGLVMGYAALEARQIERGCELLAQAADELRGRR